MADSSSNIDVRYYIGLVLKRRYIALAVLLVVVSVFTWGSFFWPKTFQASSTVFIDRSSIIDPLIKGVGVSSSIDERLRSLKDSITSRNIIERVVKKLDLETKTRNQSQYEALLSDVKKKLQIMIKTSGRDKATELFTISYQDSEPKVARDIVNTLVSEYIEENVGYRRSDASEAYEFIEGQLLEYKKKLEDSDKAIREFRERNPNLIPRNEQAVMTRMEGFQSQLVEAEIRLKEVHMKRSNLQKQLSGEKELTVSTVTRDRDSSPQARLNYLNNQIIILMTKFTENHPEIVKMKGEIEELKKQIAMAKESKTDSQGTETAAMNPLYQQLREEFAKADTEADSLRARIQELSRQHQMAQGVLGRMPKEQEEWSKLQRDRSVFQKIYDDLLQKLENARVSKDLELTDKNAAFRIVDPAVVPRLPITPNRVQLILLGIALGLAAGVGVSMGLEFLNQSFRDADQIEADLRMPVLISIPKIITEEDQVNTKKKDRRIFTAAAAYMGVIIVVLAVEFLYRYMGIRIIPF